MESNANIALLPVDGDLDVTTVAPLRASIDRLIDGGCQRVVLNMAAVGFVDSAGMGLIFREIRKMRSSGGLLSLVNVTPPVMRALALARVVDYAPVSANVGEVDVPELDPGAQPLWRYVIRIDRSSGSISRMTSGSTPSWQWARPWATRWTIPTAPVS